MPSRNRHSDDRLNSARFFLRHLRLPPHIGDLRCAGVKEASGSLDTLGLIARSVADISLYRDVLFGIEPQPVPADSGVPKIGFCRTHLWPIIEPHTQKLLEDAARALGKAGAIVKEVALPQIRAYQTRIDGYQRLEFARNLPGKSGTWEGISERLRGDASKTVLRARTRSISRRATSRKNAALTSTKCLVIATCCSLRLQQARRRSEQPRRATHRHPRSGPPFTFR